MRKLDRISSVTSATSVDDLSPQPVMKALKYVKGCIYGFFHLVLETKEEIKLFLYGLKVRKHA